MCGWLGQLGWPHLHANSTPFHTTSSASFATPIPSSDATAIYPSCTATQCTTQSAPSWVYIPTVTSSTATQRAPTVVVLSHMPLCGRWGV